jgi:hypothetical protein
MMDRRSTLPATRLAVTSDRLLVAARILAALALVLALAVTAPASVLAASPEPSATPVPGSGLGEAVGIGPPALGLVGIVGGIVVIVLLGRLARRRWPEP